MSDTAALMEKVMLGDQNAFEHLHRAVRKKLWLRFWFWKVRQDLIDDLVEETLYQVWTIASKFDPSRARFETWMYGIARNKMLGARKADALYRSRQIAGHSGLDKALSLASAAEDLAVTDSLQKALDQLDPSLLECVILFDMEGLEAGDVAETLGLALSTVRSRHSVALEELRRLLKKGGGRQEAAPAFGDEISSSLPTTRPKHARDLTQFERNTELSDLLGQIPKKDAEHEGSQQSKSNQGSDK